MAGGINIQFLSDVSGFLRGTKDIESALDKVGDSLDGLSKDAQKVGEGFGEEIESGAKGAESAIEGLGKSLGSEIESGADKAESAVDGLGQKIESSLESADEQAETAGKAIGREIETGAEKAEDAAKNLERKFRDAFDTVSDTSRKAGTDLGTNVESGARRAGDGLDNMKDEANETAREVAASFDGSAESIFEGFQEVAAVAFGGFGPAAAIAGLAVAGAAGAWYAAWQEKAEQAEERIRSMYEDMLASGQNFLSAQYVNEGISKIITGADDAAISMEKAREISERTGLSLQTVLRAWAGDADATAVAQSTLNGRIADAVSANDAGVFALRGYEDSLRRSGEATGTAAEQAEIYRSTVIGSAEASREYAQAVAGVDDAFADFSEAVAANSEAWAGNAEQLRAENLGALADLADELVGVQESAVAAGASAEDLTALQRDQVVQFAAAAEAAGFTADEAARLASEYLNVPAEVVTEVLGDTSQATGALEELTLAIDSTTGTVTINGNPAPAGLTLGELLGNVDSSTGTVQIAGNRFPADMTVEELKSWIGQQGGTVTVNAATAAAEEAINYTARDRTATIRVRTFSDSSGPAGSTGNLYAGYASGGYVGGFPDGGMVGGPGGPIDDRVLARLSRGEYVLDAQTVQQIGAGRLDQINNGQRSRGAVRTSSDDASLADQVASAVARALSGARFDIEADALIGNIAARLRLAESRRAGVR